MINLCIENTFKSEDNYLIHYKKKLIYSNSERYYNELRIENM